MDWITQYLDSEDINQTAKSMRQQIRHCKRLYFSLKTTFLEYSFTGRLVYDKYFQRDIDDLDQPTEYRG